MLDKQPYGRGMNKKNKTPIPADMDEAAVQGLTMCITVLLENLHSYYLDCFLEFIPMCIGTYCHPSFRNALLQPDAEESKQSIMVLVKKLMLQEGSLVLPKLYTIMYSPETTRSKSVPTPTIAANN